MFCPTLPAFVSTHSLPLTEYNLPRSVPKQTRYAPAFFFPVSLFRSSTFYDDHVTAALLSLLLPVPVSASFPATTGCKGRGVRLEETLALLSLAPNAGIIQISPVDPPNCLHILLTPSALQPRHRPHKDKDKRNLRALHRSCLVERAEPKGLTCSSKKINNSNHNTNTTTTNNDNKTTTTILL